MAQPAPPRQSPLQSGPARRNVCGRVRRALLLVLLLSGVGAGLVLLILAARRVSTPRAVERGDGADPGAVTPPPAAPDTAGARSAAVAPVPAPDAPLDELVRRLRVELARLAWEPLREMAAERGIAVGAAMTHERLIDAIVDDALGRPPGPRTLFGRTARRDRRLVPRRRPAAATALA